MSEESGETDVATPSPDDAFAVLGNETRMEILQTLSEAAAPLSFSELRDRVGMRDSGQFNYHLEKLRGHFVRQTEDGYELHRAGDRVIQAVLSGAITESPVMDPTEIDAECAYCGSSTVVSFREGYLRHFCTECSGTYGDSTETVDPGREAGDRNDGEELGFLGAMELPPAGIRDRTPTEVYDATVVWGALDLLATGRGVCPRCSAPIERSVTVCDDHDATDGVCERCGYRHAAIGRADCTNCPFESRAPFVLYCLAAPDVLAFLATRGVDPLGDWAAVDWTETITGTDPFEARFTCTVDGDALTLTVDDTLGVVDVTVAADEPEGVPASDGE